MQLLSLLLLAVVAMVGAWETDLEALRFIINAEDLECSNAADKPRACCVMCMKKAPSKPEKSLVKYPDDPLKSDEYHLGWKYWPTMTGDRPFTDPPTEAKGTYTKDIPDANAAGVPAFPAPAPDMERGTTDAVEYRTPFTPKICSKGLIPNPNAPPQHVAGGAEFFELCKKWADDNKDKHNCDPESEVYFPAESKRCDALVATLEAPVFGVDCSGAVSASPGASPAANCTQEVAALKGQLAALQATAGKSMERDEDANIDEADLEATACEEMVTLKQKVADLKQANEEDMERNAPRPMPFPTKKHKKHH